MTFFVRHRDQLPSGRGARLTAFFRLIAIFATISLLFGALPESAAALPHKHDGAVAPALPSCMADADLETISQFIPVQPVASSVGRPRGACAVWHDKYRFYPIGGVFWGDLGVGNFNDLDFNPGSVLDYQCGGVTYDGHDATDTGIADFEAQSIGVPIYAAMDGFVLSSHDGEPDMNTELPNVPSNHAIINHGNGRIVNYLHFKTGSTLVSPGDHVVAGQQIGMVGSSGRSSGPHLHFATYDNDNRYEPFAGACRPGESGWYEQFQPPTTPFVRDFGLSREDIGTAAQFPFALPRTGQFEFNDSNRLYWVTIGMVPPNPEFTLRTLRPDGTLAAQYSFVVNDPSVRLGGWRWGGIPFHSDLNTVAGTWRLQVDISGTNVVDAPFEVVAEYDPSLNRAPLPVGLAFEPSAPRIGDVIFCRVIGSMAVDDVDYDRVRYEYVWRVDGQEVRRIVSAGRADAIPRTHAFSGASIECTVTPMDASLAGDSTTASVLVAPLTYDCNGNGVFDDTDIAQGVSPDANSNGIPDECENEAVFVDAAAVGDNNGASWEDAFVDLQSALRLARANPLGPSEIWIAAGEYRPDYGCGGRNLSFFLSPGDQIYGGFSGTETLRDQRDPATNVTVLTGDLSGNDTSDPATRADNSFHVVQCSFTSPGTLLDGMTIRGGRADGSGFKDARAGGLWIEYGAPTIRNCTFVENSCSANGGAVWIERGAEPIFEDCRFDSNRSDEYAGAVQMTQSSVEFYDCMWEDNSAEFRAGAMLVDQSSAYLENCTLIGNETNGVGGAVEVITGEMTVDGGAFAQNIAAGGGGALIGTGVIHLDGTDFVANTSPGWDAGAVWLFSGGELIASNCQFIDNSCIYSGGAIQSGGPLTLEDCLFQGNMVGNDGGAIRCFDETVVDRCRFVGNTAIGGAGGAILAASAFSTLDVSSSLFNGNTAPYAAAILSVDQNDVTVSNTTIAANTATNSVGGIIIHADCIARIENAIVRSNIGGASPDFLDHSGAAMVSHSCVGGYVGGTGNIDVDPDFVDASSGDFHLVASSPCIDSGDNALVPSDAMYDVEGSPRIVDGDGDLNVVVDMGAFEFQPFVQGDVNGDGVLDMDDVVDFVGVLLGSNTDPDHVERSDVNNDASADGDDVQPFVAMFIE